MIITASLILSSTLSIAADVWNAREELKKLQLTLSTRGDELGTISSQLSTTTSELRSKTEECAALTNDKQQLQSQGNYIISARVSHCMPC